MNSAMLIALLPLLILGGTALLLMALISFWRNHTAAMLLTLIGLGATLATAVQGMSAAPLQVTPLLQVEPIGLFFVALFALAAIGATLFSHAYLDGRSDQPEEYYMLLSIATLGAAVLALAGHFASFVLGLEVLSIALYGLISYPEEGNAPIEAAAKYLVLSGVATATMLFGMALVYSGLGTMSFADIGARMAMSAPSTLLTVGQAMIIVGVAFKLSLVPFHMWTPDVYEGAPAPVTGYLASVAKAAMVIAILRYAAVTSVLSDPGLFNLVSTMGVLSMVIGNLLALQQQNVKRLLAYSSIAHLGYLLIAFPLIAAMEDGAYARQLSLDTTMVYLATYVLTSVGAFGVVGLIAPRAGAWDRHDLAEYRGLFWRQPVLAGAFTVMLMSLAGLPLTLGFMAKLYVLGAGLQGQLWLLVWALVLGSALGAFYYLRVVAAMLARAPEDASTISPAFIPLATVASIALVLLVLGVYPTPLLDFTEATVASAFGSTNAQSPH